MYCSHCGAWAPEGAAACTTCQAPLGAPAPAAFAPVGGPAAGASIAGDLPRSAYAGFWRRFLACLVDMLLFFFPESLMRIGLGMPLFSTDASEYSDPRFWQVGIALFLGRWLYSAILESSPLQGTLGQRLLGLRVANVNGQRIGFGRASLRHFGQWLSGLTLGIGYLMNLWTRRRQTLHDLVAGTVVMRDPSAAGGR